MRAPETYFDHVETVATALLLVVIDPRDSEMQAAAAALIAEARKAQRVDALNHAEREAEQLLRDVIDCTTSRLQLVYLDALRAAEQRAKMSPDTFDERSAAAVGNRVPDLPSPAPVTGCRLR